MADDLWQVFGIHSGHGIKQNPLTAPAARVAKISCIDSADFNLWYGQLYAAARGLKPPGQSNICSFGIPTIDVELLQQISPPVSEHHHKPPPVPKVSSLAIHQGVNQKGYIKKEQAERAQQQNQADYKNWQSALQTQRQMIESIAKWMPLYLHRFDVMTIPRISCFLGNAAVESAAFTTFEEDQRFTHASALMNAHRAAFPTEKSTDGYLGNPQAVANRAYSSEFQPSLGNGPFGNGNGWKYRGRGIFQITGLYNYTLFSKFTGIDAVSNPDMLLQPEGAVASAFWFWNFNNLNHLADVYMFQQIGAQINGTNPPYKWLEREQYRTFSAARIIERMLSVVL
jgi:putative chitinase